MSLDGRRSESSGGVSMARSESEEKKDIKERAKEGKGTHQTRHHTPHQRENPGIPVRSPSKPTNNLFFINFFDLPCKRTCHGKGR